MGNSLAHRGPNDSGTYSDEHVGLASQRLSVIDLSSAGHMPMSNEDGTVWLAYNGEVYNFRELADRFQLVERGHCFRSRTDTEVLIHLYEELGIEMLEHLNGMFAFALWDKRVNKLFLSRDHAGIKPLFYQHDDKYLRFGSEIKAILRDPRVKRCPSLQALHDFLTFDYIPGPQTAFEGIHELPPGTWLSMDQDGTIDTGRYWRLSWEPDDSLSASTAAKQAGELIEQAVQRQLVADVPVGVMLSGGMDSSTLVALMHRHVKEPIHTYSIGFEDQSFDELPAARLVAQEFATVQHEVVIDAGMVRDLLPIHLKYIDEPYADGSAIPTYAIAQLAKDTVVVLLSGEGGDEIFAGYDTYAAYKASQWFRAVPSWIRAGISPLVHSLPVSHKKLSLEFKMKRFLGGQDLPPEKAHLWWRIVLSEQEKQRLYTKGIREELAALPSDRFFVREFERAEASDTLSKLMQIDLSVFLPDDLMIKNDRMTMAHSLEARVPFTDTELMRFMATVPAGIRLPGLRKKNVMRQAMRNALPPAIINKKKIGLEMPYSRWFRHELKDLLKTHLGRDRIQDRGLFQPEEVQRIMDDHWEGRRDNGRALWGLLSYMLWLERYIP